MCLCTQSTVYTQETGRAVGCWQMERENKINYLMLRGCEAATSKKKNEREREREKQRKKKKKENMNVI